MADIWKKFSPVLRHFFLENFREPAAWFERRLAFTRSVAVNSMAGAFECDRSSEVPDNQALALCAPCQHHGVAIAVTCAAQSFLRGTHAPPHRHDYYMHHLYSSPDSCMLVTPQVT